MKSRFDEIVERRGTASVKHDNMEAHFGQTDLLPMWVADMDFKSPQVVLDAAMERCKHGVFGYSFRTDDAKQAFVDWVAKRDNWQISKESVTISPGICTALSIAVRCYSKPGDRVVIMTPVYHPFHEVVLRNERELSRSPLHFNGSGYEIDWVDLESRLNGAAMLILCNPHNPLGRAWSVEELKRMGDLCVKYGVIIISDEIHSDLMLFKKQHHVMAQTSPEIADITLTCMAPSKTFNIAGMLNSLVVATNPELLRKFNEEITTLYLDLGNLFGHITLEAAYRHGAEWLDELMEYLSESVLIAEKFVAEEIPGVTFVRPEASFLIWLDFRGTGYSHTEVKERLISKGRVALNDGLEFGADGEGFMRLNIGCPHSVLLDGLNRIKLAMQ